MHRHSPPKKLRLPARQTMADIARDYSEEVLILKPVLGESVEGLASLAGVRPATYRRAMRGLRVLPTHFWHIIAVQALPPARRAEILIREVEAATGLRLPQLGCRPDVATVLPKHYLNYAQATEALLGERSHREVVRACAATGWRVGKTAVADARGGAVPRPTTARALLHGSGATEAGAHRWVAAYGCARHPALRGLLLSLEWVDPDRYPATARWLHYIRRCPVTRQRPDN